jgi:ABC-type transport system involved in cytochrome bd biosynthesis fused ATPase/permease subunit
MNASDTVHEEMDDLVRHLDLWRTYGTGDQVRSLVHRLGSRAAKARIQSETIGVTISSANEVLGAAALLAVLFVASLGLGIIDGGSIIAFIALFFMAYRPLRDLGDARTAWLRGREALDTLSKIHAPTPPSQPALPRPHNPHLRIDRLHVPGKSPQISFDLAHGRMIALAGPTGAGKTTLLRALLGLEPSADGLVSVNGQSLHPGQVGPDFRPFAWVPQDAPVVSGSLEDNFHIAGATVDDALEKLESLGARDLDRSIGEGKLGIAGRALSGGERRWISLARALATGLPVLLLDEPTVGLDGEARDAVLGMLERTKGRRSLVVASHDDDVLALADEIVAVRR